MFAPFPEDKAHSFCLRLIEELKAGKIKLIPVTRESEERKNQGIMLGCLVCNDGNGGEIILATCSGIHFMLQGNETENNSADKKIIFVEPIVSAEAIQNALCKNDLQIHELTEKINLLKKENTHTQQTEKISLLAKQRQQLTTDSLKKVHDLYKYHCADGSVKTLEQACIENYGGRLPPTGTGECCAPKLLDYAYRNNLIPESMCEVYFDEKKIDDENEIDDEIVNKNSGKKISGKKYPPCDERCGKLLPSMLGLKILYRDDDIIVVNKQSGLLSVPGRGPDKQDCIVNRVKRLFPFCIEQPSVHRLDMETSGLMVLAFTKEAQRNLRIQFENQQIEKKYIAVVDGVLPEKNIPDEGTMELYFRLDVDNRPHQIWDEVYGKKAVTNWKLLNVEKYTAPDGTKRNVSRILFMPETGRTHQLRLASADPHGFGLPIIGDTLYGKCMEGERLLLHANYLRFTHPSTNEPMEFFCESEF